MATWDEALATVVTLDAELTRRDPLLRFYDSYYRGEHRLAFASEKFRSAFGRLFAHGWADNWSQLVVDAVEERLNIEGFRLAEGEQADKDAWRIWQANDLDAESQMLHTDTLIGGRGFVSVWASDDPETPDVCVEHATQMVVSYRAGTRQRTAALKRILGEDGHVWATLFLPDEVWRFRQRERVSTLGLTVDAPGSLAHMWRPSQLPAEVGSVQAQAWELLDDGMPNPVPNPLGEVPVVELRNRPRIVADPESEIATIVPIQDAVNKLVADMLVAAEFAAFRQRWVTGMEIPTDPVSGQPVEPFKAAVDRLWVHEDPQTRFGEFSATDLTNFVGAVEMLIQHIASQTRTPPHYFYLRGSFPSGESLRAAETGLVAKCRRRMTPWSEAWEQVMRLAGRAAGNAGLANAVDMETIWADPESRTESEHTDAVLKMSSMGVPKRGLWELLGFSPQQIERYEQWARAADTTGALLDTLLKQGQPPAAPAAAGPPSVAAMTATMGNGAGQPAGL